MSNKHGYHYLSSIVNFILQGISNQVLDILRCWCGKESYYMVELFAFDIDIDHQ